MPFFAAFYRINREACVFLSDDQEQSVLIGDAKPMQFPKRIIPTLVRLSALILWRTLLEASFTFRKPTETSASLSSKIWNPVSLVRVPPLTGRTRKREGQAPSARLCTASPTMALMRGGTPL